MKHILSQQAQFCNDVLYKLSRPLSLDRLDFELPVSFSWDLRVVSILGWYIEIERRYQETHDFHQHQYTMRFVELNPWTDLARIDPHLAKSPVPTTFASCLSPSGKEMLVARPSIHNDAVSALTMELRKWDLLLYHSLDNYSAENVAKSATMTRVDRYDLTVDYQNTQDFGKHFLFHPFLPVLVFCLGNTTIAWSYSEPGRAPK